MRVLFGDLKVRQFQTDLSSDDFATDVARFLATLNAIHPFREGNGRTQTSFLLLLADHAGYPIDPENIDPEKFLAAMVASFFGKERPLAKELRRLLRP